ncbi:MAG: DUF2007 domain-containing protein [Christensenella sp.]|uniref:putative signal transducing protein n=1 Tax=Christensenella sp. TaxID=1935934 RepID=UPI002B21FA04|nr:DUF2007 domain-containing protein [Christensenella sp.]MEA5004270.1 DUF2007 domain-containing protein [Christensenella sp.]
MPFCPQCHDEYDEGYTVCADCGCTLVDALAVTPAVEDDPPHAMRPVLLHKTDDLQSKLIANLLEQEGIPVLVRDETLAGNYVSIYSGYSVYGKKLYVDEADLARAQEFLEGFLSAAATEDADADFAEDDFEKELSFFQRPRNRALVLFLGIPIGIGALLWIIWLLSQFPIQ